MTVKSEKKQSVAIVGLGLIGASLALALRDKYHIVGCSRSRKTEEYALSRGMAHEICPIDKLRGVDCVVVCTPLWVLKDTVKAVYESVGDSAIITDVGSVKGILKGMPGRIVGGHPMAGTEHSGIEAAKEHLFENACYCIVPYENSANKDVEFVTEIARAVRAKPILLTCEEHDRLAADFSHMPHAAAYALAETSVGDNVSIAGSGFMDCTRIAGSDPDFWTEVFKLNRDNVLCSLNSYMSELNKMRKLMEKGDYDALKEILKSAQSKRNKLAAARSADSDLSLSVDVKDEVGSIGAVASLLMRGGVSIANIRILDSREGVGGALMLEFPTVYDAKAAKAALKDAGYAVW